MVYNGNGATDLTSFQFYLDGVAQPMVTQAAGYATQTNVSRIGAAEQVANNWYGLIEDVRIYSRALSGAEVEELAALTCD